MRRNDKVSYKEKRIKRFKNILLDIDRNTKRSNAYNNDYDKSKKTYDKKLDRKPLIKRKIETTGDLSNIIQQSVSPKYYIKSCARVFQAIRMHVNNEVGELIYFLYNVERILKKNGTLSIISFHSIEDKIVKNFLKYNALPVVNEDSHESIFMDIIKEKGNKEKNIRSRSSILRSGVKLN